MGRVLLGADSFDQYLKGFAGSAAVIGRFANRIAKRDSRWMALNTRSPPTAVSITFTVAGRDSPKSSGRPNRFRWVSMKQRLSLRT